MLKYVLAAAAGLVAVTPAGAVVNLIQNGSFELGTDPGAFTQVNPGDTNIANWAVTSGSVDYIGSYWQPKSGSRSVDLAGAGPGTIEQSFATVASKVYNVSFWLSANPDQSYTRVLVASPGTNMFSYTPGASNSAANMNYVNYSFNFTAGGPSSTIQFSSGTTGPWGPALDDVSVTAVPEPLTWGMMVIGFGAMGAAMRRRRPVDAFSL